MTYCYVFNAKPDGVGIVTDTRLSRITTFGEIEVIPDDYLKVYNLTKRAVIVFSGTIDHIKRLLDGITEALSSKKDSIWFDSFIEYCSHKYYDCCEQGVFTDKVLPEVQLIYADIRHNKGSTKCRVIRLDFGYSENKPKVFRKTAKDGQYLSIGWSKQGRRELNIAASNALSELESRSLFIRDVNKAEKDNFESIHGKLSRNSNMSIMDSSGVKDGTFRKVLRKYCKNLPSITPGTMHYEPVMIYSSVAEKAISKCMENLRRIPMPYHESVGNNFVISTITQKQGLKIYSDEELKTINVLFNV